MIVLQGHFQVKDPTSLEDYLGVQIVQSDDGKKAWLGQPTIIESLEKQFGEKVTKKKMTITRGTPGLLVERWMIFQRWMRKHWVHFQGVHNLLDLLSGDQEELKTTPAQQVYSLDDHRQCLYLRTNQIKQICELITYMKHLFGSYNSGIAPSDNPFHPFSPDEWIQQTHTQIRAYLIQHLPDPHGLEPVPSGPISSTRPTGYSTAAIELMGFKQGIKREIAAYPSLRDERYFDGFKRSCKVSQMQ